MRFVVVGAGAIGAYVGAHLANAGADVVLVARGEHLRAMQRDGVRILEANREFTAHPVATGDLAAVADANVVFLGVKAYSLAEIAPSLGSVLPPHAAVLPAQNGIPWWFFHGLPGPLMNARLTSLDPTGIVAESIPARHVVGCVVFCSAELVEPGVVRHIEGTRFTIGELDGAATDRCRDIATAFAAGGLRCPVERRLREHLWLKLIGNVAFNPISTLTGATMGEMAASPELVEVLRNVLQEAAAIGERLGISVPVSVERRLEAAFAVGNHKTSMLHDFEAGKRLELDCMTGALCEIAALLDMPVPHLETVHGCVKAAEARRLRPAAAG